MAISRMADISEKESRQSDARVLCRILGFSAYFLDATVANGGCQSFGWNLSGTGESIPHSILLAPL